MSWNSAEEEFSEHERYELREPARYRFEASRREFVQVLGAGLAIAVAADRVWAQRPAGRGQRGPRRGEKLAERFHLADTGIVTVLTSKVEVGQGSRTQIAQAAAEELRLPVHRIQVVMSDTQRCPDDGGTAGSRTTPSTVPRVRTAAAALHDACVRYASQRLGADRADLQIGDGVFARGGQSVSLADLARDVEFARFLQQPVPSELPLVRIDHWQVLGRPIPKLNGDDVVRGAVRYPSDTVRAGMLYGRVLRPVALNATLKSIDLIPARALPGVVVVQDGDFVGCAAPTSREATQAVDALAASAQWNRSPHPDSDSLFDHLKRTATRSSDRSAGKQRNASGGEGPGDPTELDVDYTVAYIQHAPMEPRAAVAEWSEGHLTVWTGTQQPSRVQGELSQAFRIPAEQVRVIVPDTGGGFGGKHTGEVAVEAARLAKAAGRPVSLRWTREEEFTWAYFRPAGLIEVRAALDASGQIASWDFTNYNSGGSAVESPYRIGQSQSRFVGADSPLRQGSYRALASTANTFARESAMDELAVRAGSDPLDFRLRHLEPGRLKDVLVAAAGRFRWRERRGRSGGERGIGLACGTEKGSYVAACVEVEMRAGKVKLLSVCEAYECGAIHNPRNLRAQVHGAIIMGLGGALLEAVAFRDGKILNPSFSKYRVPRMDDVPELDIVLVDRRDLASVGAGETPIIAVAPAIANAIFHATGRRLRSLPLAIETA
ncbi:MAG: molybdopterin cofactor-binding domain-containing protein [Pirellulaceae bacterium]